MYVEILEQLKHSPVWKSAGHHQRAFFVWMKVVSHLLFEASRKINAQLQTVVVDSGQQGYKRERLNIGFDNEKCGGITCACLANGP